MVQYYKMSLSLSWPSETLSSLPQRCPRVTEPLAPREVTVPQKAGEFNQQDFCRGWAEAWTFSEARWGKWPWDPSHGEINACLWQLFSKTTTPQARAARQERHSFPATSLCVWWELRQSHSLGWWWHTTRSDQYMLLAVKDSLNYSYYFWKIRCSLTRFMLEIFQALKTESSWFASKNRLLVSENLIDCLLSAIDFSSKFFSSFLLKTAASAP